ncbi:hypothetical protein CHX26_11345 [Porphyrobacter sp. HT-58-2]|uniref:hypothetical protein n=1 Tax=Porphyrobacter sp. HT-58-2 TaxID=2023229 RepID=UPI000CDBDC04|nr:hypothetical protein [Porphyrobacter sp. HT-58-2]AUX70001.1 hypothetical protein CHX26_11345 [Porphyrobacter sp. HT-58-2]
MRVGLIAALRDAESGERRASLMLAGRSVLAWQVALLQSLGVERVLCLCDRRDREVLQLQHMVEAGGAAFHALQGFAAIPALVRSEDDLIILHDGLVPDPTVVRALVGAGSELQRMVAGIPSDHPLATTYPEDFERIDAARHWAGLLVMRGKPVQQLADFPADADAISVLLRLALQAGTPCRELTADNLAPESWLLAESAAAVVRHEQALIAAAAGPADWRVPSAALAGRLVRALAPRGLVQGGLIAGSVALALLAAAVLIAVFGAAFAALGVAALGSFAARVSLSYASLSAALRRVEARPRAGDVLKAGADLLVAANLWFALAPWPEWQPLAVLGPLTIGMARLTERSTASPVLAIASDRVCLLCALALATAANLLPEAIACLALGLLAGLLLRGRVD